MLQKFIFHKHLEKGEKIIYVVHKHWINILNPTLRLAFFGLLIPWSLYIMGFNTFIFFWIAFFWSLFAFLHFIYDFINWYSDVFLITSMDIIWVEWSGLFKNAATRMGFEDIEGVSYEINGFWPTVFNYGRVNLKSVSGNILGLYPARNPKQVELNIMKYQHQYLRSRDMEDAGKLKQLLSQMVSGHLRRGGKSR